MKASTGFALFLVFLAGYALVNLRNMGEEAVENIPTIEELSRTAWRPSHLGEMRLDKEVSLYVQFEPGGELSGNGGCNRFFGSYQLAGATIVIERLGTTRMACPAPVMSIEIAFIEALQSAATIARNESRMALRNEAGQATVRFDAMARID